MRLVIAIVGVLQNYFQLMLLFSEVMIEAVALKDQPSYCGKLILQRCKNDGSISNNCTETVLLPNSSETEKERKWLAYSNVSMVLCAAAGSGCHLTLCDDENRMGYCVQFSSAVEKNQTEFAVCCLSILSK